MAMVNQMLNLTGTVKDSRWLTLEVCREFQRSKCSRTENECKFAHPPAHVEVQNGRVTACFDSIKGKCQRKDPPCKYLHPPQHLKEQLLQNGRNNLILKNLQMQAVHQATIQPIVPGMVPAVIEDGYSDQYSAAAARRSQYPQTSSALSQFYINGPTMMPTHPYLGTVPTSAVGFNPYSCMTGVPAMNLPSATEPQVSQQVHGVVPAVHANQQKVARPDRLEVCREFQRGTCTRQPSECRFAHPPENVTVDSCDNQVTVCMDYIKGKCSRDSCRYFHPPLHLQAQIKAAQQRANVATVQAQAMNSIPGMVPYAKRMAVTDNKSGVPMYQPAGLASYQQALAAMQLQQQPYIPVTFTGHPPSVPRF